MIISLLLGFLPALWNDGKQVYHSRRFTSDIMDSPFIAGTRILYWNYSHRLKGGEYATFSIIPKYPHPGYIIRQGVGLHIATPEIMRSRRKRLWCCVFKSRRPCLQIGLPVSEFTVSTIEEAMHACKQRGKFAMKESKGRFTDDEMPLSSLPSIIPINYRDWKIVLFGMRALKNRESESFNFAMTDIRKGRWMGADPETPIDIQDFNENRWRDWNIKISAEKGIAWHGDIRKLEWHSFEFLYNLSPLENENTKNANVSIGEVGVTAPIWTGKKAFLSQTLSDVFSRLGIDNDQLSDACNIKLSKNPKKKDEDSVRIVIKDYEGTRFHNGDTTPYEFSFLWRGIKGKLEEAKSTSYSDTPIVFIDKNIEESDGVVDISKILPILEMFGVTAQAEYYFKLIDRSDGLHEAKHSDEEGC